MGRSFEDLMNGRFDAAQADRVETPPASGVAGLQARLKDARESGDSNKAGEVLALVRKRREALSETGIVKPAEKKITYDVSQSVVPSAEEIRSIMTNNAARETTPRAAEAATIASPEVMKDVASEVNGWGAEPRSPGQFSPKKVAETDEAREMAESPEGPKNPPRELASVLMDKLEAHHAHLTSVLRGLPEQLRYHGQQSPYFGPAHSLFADQLETGGEAGLDKPDRESLREKRDLIASSQPNASKFELRRRARITEQNFAASSYTNESPVIPFANTPIRGVAAPTLTERSADSDGVAQSYIQDVPEDARVGKKSAALRGVYGEIDRADLDALKNVPAHIRALTVDLPTRLGKIKQQMKEVREDGVFKGDNPAVNHKAIMDIADSLSVINNSINSNIATGTKNAIKDTFDGRFKDHPYEIQELLWNKPPLKGIRTR